MVGLACLINCTACRGAINMWLGSATIFPATYYRSSVNSKQGTRTDIPVEYEMLHNCHVCVLPFKNFIAPAFVGPLRV